MDIVVMYNKENRHWGYASSFVLSDFTEIKNKVLMMGG